MISGGGGVVGVGALERLHSVHGVRKVHLASSISKSFSARCAVSDDMRLESFSAPSLTRDTVKSGSEQTPVLQQHHLSLKKEGGVQVWRVNDLSLRGGAITGGPSFNRQRLISEIAEAAVSESENVGGSGGIEASQSEDGALSSKGGVFGTGFKFDLVQGIQDLTKRAEVLKEEVTSYDYRVSPTPYTPMEGPEAVRFALLTVGLLFIFWLGNYYVPDQVFKNTVFKKEPEDPTDQTGTTSKDNKLAVNNQQSLDGSTVDSKTSVDDAGRLASKKVGTGFGQSKQKRSKSAKRK